LPFSKHDDVKLYEGLKEYGQKWTLISKEFFGNERSDIQLKNRFKTKSFQQFYNKVVKRAMEILRWQKLNLDVIGNMDVNVIGIGIGKQVSANDNGIDNDNDNAETDAETDTGNAQADSQKNNTATEIQGPIAGNSDMDQAPIGIGVGIGVDTGIGIGTCALLTTGTGNEEQHENGIRVLVTESPHMHPLSNANANACSSPQANSPTLTYTDTMVQQQHEQQHQPIHVKDANQKLTSQRKTQSKNKTKSPLAKRLQTSLAAQVLNEDVPKPPQGQYFTPLGAAHILTTIGTSERRTVMKIWIERNYVPVNLTSLYRALGRYTHGLKLKPRWYCEGRMGEDSGAAAGTGSGIGRGNLAQSKIRETVIENASDMDQCNCISNCNCNSTGVNEGVVDVDVIADLSPFPDEGTEPCTVPESAVDTDIVMVHVDALSPGNDFSI